jgi:hypothetical protein
MRAQRRSTLMLRSRAFGPRTQIFNARWRGVSKHEGAASSPFETRARMSEFVQPPQHALLRVRRS